MIDALRTTHPTEGCAVIVRFIRVNNQIKILQITDVAGKDIWGQMASSEIQHFKSQIQ